MICIAYTRLHHLSGFRKEQDISRTFYQLPFSGESIAKHLQRWVRKKELLSVTGPIMTAHWNVHQKNRRQYWRDINRLAG